ncbi:hypothetical protein M9458_038796, partial [Cirrhinus mrigala]
RHGMAGMLLRHLHLLTGLTALPRMSRAEASPLLPPPAHRPDPHPLLRPSAMDTLPFPVPL